MTAPLSALCNISRISTLISFSRISPRTTVTEPTRAARSRTDPRFDAPPAAPVPAPRVPHSSRTSIHWHSLRTAERRRLQRDDRSASQDALFDHHERQLPAPVPRFHRNANQLCRTPGPTPACAGRRQPVGRSSRIKASGQFMSQAMGNVTKELAAPEQIPPTFRRSHGLRTRLHRV